MCNTLCIALQMVEVGGGKGVPKLYFSGNQQKLFFFLGLVSILRNAFTMSNMQENAPTGVHNISTPSKISIHIPHQHFTSKFPSNPAHIPHHNPPQKPNPILHRSKLQTALTQKMKMKKMPLKTVKMTSWMSRTRLMMKRRLLTVRKTSWKTVKRRQKCWQQNA